MQLAPQDVKQAISEGQPNAPSQTVAKYAYKPLQDVDEIRLLHIEPGSWESNPQCTLSHHRLPQCPSFEALSYVWGSEEKPCKISCGQSGILAVTQNCFAAIKRLRKLGSLVVWIDAVCIDQRNDLERGHQVRNMPDIYKTAAKVLVYLGEAEDHGDEAMETLRFFKWKVSTYLNPLRKLMQRSWFERLWVLQEVNKAQTLTVICGDRVAPWDPCFRLLVQLGPENLVRVELPYTLHIRGYGQNNFQSWDLFEMLVNTRPYKCTDPRDRIFALLSMCSENPRYGIEPDYTATVEEVYSRAARQFLRCRGLDVLAMVDHGDQEPSNLLPSWAPDWRIRTSCTPMVKATACHPVHSRGTAPFLFTNNSTLLVCGRPFGMIHNLGRVFEPDGHGWNVSCMDDWWRRLSGQCPDAVPADLIRIMRMSTSDNSDLFTPFKTTLRSLIQSIVHTVLRIAKSEEQYMSMEKANFRSDYPKSLCSDAFFDLLGDPQLTTMRSSDFFLASKRSESLQEDYRQYGLTVIKLYNTRFERVSYSEILCDLKYILLDEIHRRGLREYRRPSQYPRPKMGSKFSEIIDVDFHWPKDDIDPIERILMDAAQEPEEPRNPPKSEKYEAIISLVRMHIRQQIDRFKPSELFYNSLSGSISSEILENIIECNWDLVKLETRSPHPDQKTRSTECHFAGPQPIHECCNGRRLFVTERFTGLVPENAQKGDILCTLTGSKFPILLRKAAGHEVFIGACYVIGDIESQGEDERYFTIM